MYRKGRAVLFYFARAELAARDVAIRRLLVGSLATGPGAARAKGSRYCSFCFVLFCTRRACRARCCSPRLHLSTPAALLSRSPLGRREDAASGAPQEQVVIVMLRPHESLSVSLPVEGMHIPITRLVMLTIWLEATRWGSGEGCPLAQPRLPHRGGPRGRFDHPAFRGSSWADPAVAIIQPAADLFGCFGARALVDAAEMSRMQKAAAR